MAHRIAFHSARAGTGKSTIVANLATILVVSGYRVGILDANLQSALMHQYFSLDVNHPFPTLNQYLLGECQAQQMVYDVTPRTTPTLPGQVLLLPASTDAQALEQVLRNGYNTDRITDTLVSLIDQLQFDFFLIDTHAGWQERTLLTMLSMAIVDTLLIVMRLDQNDYQGTGVLLDLARELEVPNIALVLNQVAMHVSHEQVQERIEQTYQCPVMALLEYSDHPTLVTQNHLFVLKHPRHPLTQSLKQLAMLLVQTSPMSKEAGASEPSSL
ncbi:MAG: AAA family ATPase [Chloroflexaceae bacterium]|nr:AAA family ATPase [Chloroflexaceae bacterium]